MDFDKTLMFFTFMLALFGSEEDRNRARAVMNSYLIPKYNREVRLSRRAHALLDDLPYVNELPCEKENT